jgi:hypothetical protein
MAEQKMIIGIGLPLILLLAMLMLFGVTWLFHHHHWRPFAGIFLFVIGLGFFALFTVRHEMQLAQPVATSGLYEAHGTERGGSTRVQSEMTFDNKTARVRGSSDGSRIAAEKPVVPAPPSTETDTKLAEGIPAEKLPSTSPAPAGSATKAADHPPDWINRPPHPEQRDGQRVYVAAATSGRYSTPAECERAVIPAINEIVARYAADYLLDSPDTELALDAAYIHNELVKDEYLESVEATVGPMYQLHALLVFDSRVRNELDNRARLAKVDGRLKYAAAGTALTLLLLGGVYSLLRKRERGTSAAAK